MSPKRGRPLLGTEPLKRVLVMLDRISIAVARRLGNGNLSAGIRKALSRRSK